MSLVSETQKKNSGVKEPVVKPVKSVLPELLPDTVVPPQQPLEQQPPAIPTLPSLPAIPEGQPPPLDAEQPPQEPVEQREFDFSLTPTASTQKPNLTPIPSTVPIWQPVTPDNGGSLKPEVSNSFLPSFSVQTPSNSVAIDKAYGSLNSTIGSVNTESQQQYAKAQQVQSELSRRGALPNTPDATKKWYSAPLGFLGDVLFGTERARKLSEAGIPDVGAASFGRQGAGLGGQLNYLLNTIPNLFVATIGEASSLASNSIQGLGVSKETAEGIARDGLLTFLPDYIGGGSGYEGVGVGSLRPTGLNIGALKPSNIVSFNFDEANKRNLFIDAIAGDPLTDINDPAGSVKYGRIYTRNQRKEGSSPTSDPVGFALQIGNYLFNPGDKPGDTLISVGISNLWRTFRPDKITQAVGKVVTDFPALPSSAMRRELELARESEAARTATAGRRINTPPAQPSSEYYRSGVDLSNINEEQLRRLNTGTPRLTGAETPDFPLLPESPPRLDGGQAFLDSGESGSRLVRPSANDDVFNDSLEEFSPYVKYQATANKPYAANPQQVPRVYNGSGEITRAALPPTFEPDIAPDLAVDEFFGEASDFGGYLPYNTPASTALKLGLGNPNLRIDNPGALAIRTLTEVKQIIAEVEPALIEDFTGVSWADFKAHIGAKVNDIGRFSSVGDALPKPQRLLTTSEVTNTDSFVQAPAKVFRERLTVTAERVRKVRSIKEKVSLSSLEALEKIDETANAKKAIADQINSYESIAQDTIDNTLKPLIRKSDESIGQITEQLLALEASGVSKEEVSRGLASLKKYSEEVDDEIDEILKGVESLKTKAESLRGNDYFIAEIRYKNALEELKTTRFTNDLLLRKYKIGEDFVGKVDDGDIRIRKAEPIAEVELPEPTVVKPTEDDLLTAAEELAQHKLALDKPLQQLDQLFAETVDFGRRTVDSVPYDFIDAKQALNTVENGGVLKLVTNIFTDTSKEGLKIKNAWLTGDYEAIASIGKKKGFSFEELLNNVIERNNTYINQANRVGKRVILPDATVKVELPLYHGTALDNWIPPQNLYVNGSRGELGGGTYLTAIKQSAIDYANARVGDNVSPKTMDYDVKPTLAEVENKFVATLDARKPVEGYDLKNAFIDLPPDILKKFGALVNKKKKPQSYLQLREALENAIVKSKLKPTEELLQQIDADISKNLRVLGFDSVADLKSGFVLSLDNTRLTVKSTENFPNPSAVESATARLNADAHAAKNYPELVTTDANIRDSNYKVLAQTRASVDKKLTQVQDEIIGRGLPEQSTILPKQPDTDTRPQSFIETLEELTDEGVCGL